MATKKVLPLQRSRELPEGIRSGARVCVNADVLVPKGSRGVVIDFDEKYWNGYTVPVLCFDGRSRHFAVSELDVEESEES